MPTEDVTMPTTDLSNLVKKFENLIGATREADPAVGELSFALGGGRVWAISLDCGARRFLSYPHHGYIRCLSHGFEVHAKKLRKVVFVRRSARD